MNGTPFDSENVFRPPTEWDKPIVEWASPRFEAVYVLLHPFVRVPVELQHSIEPEGSRWLEEDAMSLLLKNEPEHIRWDKVKTELGISTISRLLGIIQDNVIGLSNVGNESLESLLKYLKDNRILAPTSHYLPPTLIEGILKTLDIYGIESPKSGRESLEKCPYEKENLLYATPYESTYSFICSSKNILDEIVKKNNFEGFFADSRTLFDWKERA